MSKFLNRRYSGMEAYTPGEQPKGKEYIKLNTNESPYPPAPQVVCGLNTEDIEQLRLYSDPTAFELKDKLAGLYNVKPENVFLSNGSDDILNFAFMAFATCNGAVFPDITYGFYSVFAKLHCVEYKEIPLNEDFSINCVDYLNVEKTVFIANPNAPTGLTLKKDEIEQILKSNPDSIVVIDEAYVDFATESCIELIKKYGNLLVVRTFSKSRCLAGGRLGYAFACKELIDDLEKIKYSTNPYNINRLTMKLGVLTVDAEDYYKAKCNEIMQTREYTKAELIKLDFTVTDSKANFLFAKNDKISGEKLYLKLKEKGVLVRHFEKERIKEYNRITIGTREQMDIFISTVKQILEEEK